MARSVYKVSIDIKIGGKWAANGGVFAHRNVVTSGDARLAAQKVVLRELGRIYPDGSKVQSVRVLEVALVVAEVS